jgi:hypothetical protein
MADQTKVRIRRRFLIIYGTLAVCAIAIASRGLVRLTGERQGAEQMGFGGEYRWPWEARGKQAAVEVNGRGLPSYGLMVVAFSDPPFKEMMAQFFGDDPPGVIKIAAPTSVFVKNENDKALVAYKLVYESIPPGGLGGLQDFSPTLMDALKDFPASRLAEDPAISVLPGAARLTSPLFGFIGVTKGQVPGPFSEEEEKAQRKLITEGVKHTLRGASKMTVSLDGAFFEDGSFVGPDSTGFFEATKAQVDARHDLAELLVARARELKQNNKSIEELFTELESLSAQAVPPLPLKAAIDYYNYEKREAAQELLRMRRVVGSSRTIGWVAKSIERKWRVLHRLSEAK